MIKSMRILTLCGAAVLSLSACISILPDPRPAPNIYRLTDVNIDHSSPNGRATVLVRRPSAPLALQGVDIPVSPDGRRLAYAESAQWEAPVPQIVQQGLVDGFAQSEAFHPVLAAAGVSSDYALTVSVRNFEAVYDNGDAAAPMARVTMTATLTHMSSRGLVGSKTVTSTQRASTNDVSAIVKAQETALRDSVGQIVGWAEGAARPKVQ